MVRTRDEANAAWAEMVPLRERDYQLMPITARRTPWRGWRSEDYSAVDFISHLQQGGAVGVRLGPNDLIIDIDPRNGGSKSFDLLCIDLGIDLDADDVPAVRSGGGGTHLYFKKPAGHTRVSLPKVYPGIDFKREGGYIVAPGSHHPSGGRYTWIRPLGAAPDAPADLLALLAREPHHESPVANESPELTADELATLLSVLDASAYTDYPEWLAMGMACHAATAGDGFHIWAEWCATDDDYAGVPLEELEDHWRSFSVKGGVTYRTLFKAVSDAGHPDLLHRLSSRLDFDAEVERQQAAPIVDNSDQRRLAPVRGNRE